MNFVNKCLENDNNIVKYFAFICKPNPTFCAGNNYSMLLNAKDELTIEGLSVWNERCCKLNDSINVIKEMIDVRDMNSKNVKVLVERRCKDSQKCCALIDCF